MSPPLHPELLLTHASALRSMARALLRDEHAAEDVVQETWVRALTAQPSADRGLGGWLRHVAEGFALQRRRAEGRREQRERAYAAERHEALDSEQRSAVLRAVMEAVLALDEPYRETVLLRWFEGLPPRAIAERLGVRVATIDSRLQRAHARLRTKLERELGGDERGWRGVVALALGAPTPAKVLPTLAIPLIGVAVSLKVVGVTLAAVVGVCLWLGWDRARPPVVEPVGLAAADASVPVVPALAATATGGERAVVSDPAAADAPPASQAKSEPTAQLERGPYAFALHVEVVDSSENAVHDAQVFLGPLSCSTVIFGETGWDGVLEREWRGFEPEFRGIVYVRSGGQETSLRRVDLRAGERTALRFQLDPVVSVFRVQLSGLSFTATDAIAHGHTDTFTTDAAGNGVFDDSKLARVVARPAPESEDSKVVGKRSLQQRALSFDAVMVTGSRVAGTTDEAGDPAEIAPATVRGVVRDEHGKPLTDLVVGGRTPEHWNTGVVCDADGAFVFTNVPPGRMEVCVGGGERVIVREVFELAPGETRFVELRPVPRPCLHVRLVDADEKPLARWVVEARSAGSPSMTVGAATTIDEGTAVIGLSTDGPVQLYAHPESSNATAAVSVGTAMSSEKREVRLRTPTAMRTGSIAFTIERPRHAEPAEGRAWRTDSGEGVMLRSEPAEGDGGPSRTTISSRALLPGNWRVEWRTPGRPWTELGRFDVAPGQELDLGPTVLPLPSGVTLRSEDPEQGSMRFSLRAQVDGALVSWPERAVHLPLELETVPVVPIEILRRAVEGDAAATLPLRDPLRLRDGGELAIELPAPR